MKHFFYETYLDDVIFEILGHVSVGHLGQVVVGLRAPAVDPVQLQQEARLAVVVAVVLLANAFNVTALKKIDKLFIKVVFNNIFNFFSFRVLLSQIFKTRFS